MHQLLTPADYRRMPWKNGGGCTVEIATEPPGAGTAAFVWRASVADIERDGPFAVFPGVDRTLVLLDGKGMRLTSDGGSLELRSAFDPVRFPGESALHCALVDGPTRDFNLMVRRDAACGDVVVVRGAGRAIGPARTLICFAATGASECLLAGYPPTLVPPGHALLVAAERGAAAPAVHVLPADASAVALVAVVRDPATAQ